jgi:predicted nucleic acid-binding protein
MNGMRNNLIGLDTNIFIYYLHQDPLFGEKAKYIFSELIANKIKILTSVITLTELLSLKQSDKDTTKLKNFFFEIPNLETKVVSEAIALEAARIRRLHGFHLPDALQLATALTGKADMFITNDTKLRKCKEIKILSLHQFTKM